MLRTVVLGRATTHSGRPIVSLSGMAGPIRAAVGPA